MLETERWKNNAQQQQLACGDQIVVNGCGAVVTRRLVSRQCARHARFAINGLGQGGYTTAAIIDPVPKRAFIGLLEIRRRKNDAVTNGAVSSTTANFLSIRDDAMRPTKVKNLIVQKNVLSTLLVVAFFLLYNFKQSTHHLDMSIINAGPESGCCHHPSTILAGPTCCCLVAVTS